jgi:hypothetical protein
VRGGGANRDGSYMRDDRIQAGRCGSSQSKQPQANAHAESLFGCCSAFAERQRSGVRQCSGMTPEASDQLLDMLNVGLAQRRSGSTSV